MIYDKSLKYENIFKSRIFATSAVGHVRPELQRARIWLQQWWEVTMRGYLLTILTSAVMETYRPTCASSWMPFQMFTFRCESVKSNLYQILQRVEFMFALLLRFYVGMYFECSALLNSLRSHSYKFSFDCHPLKQPPIQPPERNHVCRLWRTFT